MQFSFIYVILLKIPDENRARRKPRVSRQERSTFEEEEEEVDIPEKPTEVETIIPQANIVMQLKIPPKYTCYGVFTLTELRPRPKMRPIQIYHRFTNDSCLGLSL